MPNNLRPRGAGHLLDRVFHQYRRYFPQLVAISLIFELPQLIFSAIFPQTAAPMPNWQLLSQGKTGLTHLLAQLSSFSTIQGGIAAMLVTVLIALVNMNVFTPLLYGSYYLLVKRAGSQNPDAESTIATRWLIQRARRRWLAYLSTLWLVVGIAAFGVLFFSFLFVGLILMGAPGRLLALLYTVALIFLIWIFIRLYYVFVIVVFENESNWRAIYRSWLLTKQRFWWNFIVLGAGQVILSFAGAGYTTLVSLIPNATVQTFFEWAFILLIQPIYALLVANAYWHQRFR